MHKVLSSVLSSYFTSRLLYETYVIDKNRRQEVKIRKFFIYDEIFLRQNHWTNLLITTDIFLLNTYILITRLIIFQYVMIILFHEYPL